MSYNLSIIKILNATIATKSLQDLLEVDYDAAIQKKG